MPNQRSAMSGVSYETNSMKKYRSLASARKSSLAADPNRSSRLTPYCRQRENDSRKMLLDRAQHCRIIHRLGHTAEVRRGSWDGGRLERHPHRRDDIVMDFAIL